MTIPFHHQYLLHEKIQKVCKQGGETEYITNNNLTFSSVKGQTKVSRNGLRYYSNKVTLVMSSDSKAFIDYFLSNLFKNEEVNVGDMLLKPDYVELEQDHIWSEKEKFVCLSPILIREPVESNEDHQTIDPESDEFSDELYEIIINRMEDSKMFTDEEIESFCNFQIVPDKLYLKKMNKLQKKFSRVFPVYVNGEMKYSRGYTLPFTLYAHKKVQNFVYQNGAGLLTHKGFGMVDFANIEPSMAVEKYTFSNQFVENKESQD